TGMMHPGPRHERAAANVAMRVEPRLRIIAVAIGGEARIWRERVRHPLPDRTPPIDDPERCRALPLRFGWEPPSGPAAVSLGFERVDVTHRLIWRQRFPACKPAMFPALWSFAPSRRMGEALIGKPCTTLVRPPLRVAIAAGVDERRVRHVADARLRDPRRCQLHFMRPLLVVEH